MRFDVVLVWSGGSHEIQIHGLPVVLAQRVASYWGAALTHDGRDSRDGMALVLDGVLVIVRSSSLRSGQLRTQHVQIVISE